MADFSIRPATQADSDRIRELICQTRLNPSSLNWQRFLVAISAEGDFMGCGQVKPHGRDLRELASLATRKRYRGQGVAGALIQELLALHPHPLYLMCRSALGPFYARFGFYPLELSAMPRYFQRASQVARRVAGALEVLKLLQESVLVMRVD